MRPPPAMPKGSGRNAVNGEDGGRSGQDEGPGIPSPSNMEPWPAKGVGTGSGDGNSADASRGVEGKVACEGLGEEGGASEASLSGDIEGRRWPKGEGPSARLSGASSIGAWGGKCAEGPPVVPGGGGKVGRSPGNRDGVSDPTRDGCGEFLPSWEIGLNRCVWRAGSVFPGPRAFGMASFDPGGKGPAGIFP